MESIISVQTFMLSDEPRLSCILSQEFMSLTFDLFAT